MNLLLKPRTIVCNMKFSAVSPFSPSSELPPTPATTANALDFRSESIHGSIAITRSGDEVSNVNLAAILVQDYGKIEGDSEKGY